MKLTADEFCSRVESMGIDHLLRDVTVYEGGTKYDRVLYAVDPSSKELKGYFSPVSGGVILSKKSANWSMRGRKFKKCMIKAPL